MATSFLCNWDNSLDDVAFNDISIDSSGLLRTVQGVEDVEQTVNQSLWMWKSEYLFNTILGVPYRLILGNPHITQSLIKYYLTNAILLINDYLTQVQFEIYGIKKVLEISFGFNSETRANTLTIIILLNNGAKINISA